MRTITFFGATVRVFFGGRAAANMASSTSTNLSGPPMGGVLAGVMAARNGGT